MPRPNRRLSRTAGTAKRNSLPENLPRPANIPQPKLPLAQYSPQNLEGTPRWNDKPAPHPSSWEPFGGASQSQVLHRSHSCRRRKLNETPVRLTCSFVAFFFSHRSWGSNSTSSWVATLNLNTFGNHLKLASRQTFPFSVLPGYVLCVARARSVELVAHWPSAKQNKKGKKWYKWKDKQRKHSLYLFTDLLKPRHGVWYQCERSRLPSKTGTLTYKGLTRNSESKLKLSQLESC